MNYTVSYVYIPKETMTKGEKKAYRQGMINACVLVDDMYSKSHNHDFFIGDCVLAKCNMLAKENIRPNPNGGNLMKAIDMLKKVDLSTQPAPVAKEIHKFLLHCKKIYFS